MEIVSGKNGRARLVVDSKFTDRSAAIVKKKERLENELETVQKTAVHFGQIVKILTSLPNSWKTADPGKYGEHYSFLGKDKNRVVVRELLSEEELPSNEDSPKGVSYGLLPHSKVPHHLPIIPFAEVLRTRCPRCYEPQPLIELYVQTYDSSEYDQWMKQWIVVCCDQVFVIDQRMEDDRF